MDRSRRAGGAQPSRSDWIERVVEQKLNEHLVAEMERRVALEVVARILAHA